MKMNWLLSLLLAAAATPALADDTIVTCGQNEISIIDKIFTGGMGEQKYIGRYMFVFGPLVQELQAKSLYPTQMIPGSNTAGLYWNETAEYADFTYGASVRLANGTGPFFQYYLKFESDSEAKLEVWKLAQFRLLKDGVGPDATLAFTKDFTDCRKP